MVETGVDTGLRFSVLGPLAADREGSPIKLGAPKQRAVLAMLIASPNQAVSVGRLITSIWGADASENYRRSLQTYVSNLRAVLDTEIPRHADSYVLAVDPISIDAVRFENALEQTRASIATDPGRSAARLRELLAMWRGRPYADVAMIDGIQAEINRLNELRLTAVELRIDAELAAGRHRELIAEVEALADEHPLREHFKAQHMIALYRAGRQAEALRVYDQTREYLAQELGLEPSQELQDLELAVLRHDQQLSTGTGLATTEHLVFVATSVEGLIEAWDRNPQVMGESLWTVKEIVTESVDENGGRMFQEANDRLVAAFPDLSTAVRAVSQAQKAMAGVEWEELERLGVGMAVDVGEAESRGSGFSGPPVSRSQRLADLARGGQVLLSARVQAELAASTAKGLQVRQLGEIKVPGFSQPEGVAQLIIDGIESNFEGLRPPDDWVASDGSAAFSLPGYEIRALIGRGSIGAVYKAYQPSVGRKVAIKVIRPTMSNHPLFFHKFETEARVIARLAHPHIVPLIDFWRDAEGAYLVLQYMPGGSLAEALDQGSIPIETSRRIIRQVGLALDHAHSRGVAHGDVSTTNILLDDSGNAFVADFDIASRILKPERDDGLSIPPQFPAPELTKTGSSPVADIYAFGQLIDILVDTPAIAEVVERATNPRPEARYATVIDLLQAVDGAIGGDGELPVATPTRNPYKGLRPFEEADALDFHGRGALVEEILNRMRSSKFVAVIGPSGSGKSSAVLAGVLPAIAGNAIDGSGSWPVLKMTPGFHPFESLSEGLDALATEGTLPSSQLGFGLGEAARVVLNDLDGELLVVLDQFEEIFTMVDAGTRRRFLDLIVDSVEDENSRLRLVITLRADLYDLPLLDERLGPLLRTSQVTVVPPTREELVDMITAPGWESGLEFAEGLPGRIAEDVIGRPGGLPLLQYALTEMVDNRDSDVLDVDDYEEVGGVSGALAGRAETIYQGLPIRLRNASRSVFLRMVKVDDSGPPGRRRARLAELETLGLTREDLELILAPFVAQRMLLTDRDPTTRAPTVEVAHEALMDQWPRFKKWIESERETLVLSQRLRSSQKEWESAGRHPDYLLMGSPLATYLPLFDSKALTSDERGYLTRSKDREESDRRRRRRRRRTFTGVLAGTALIGLLLAVIATTQSRLATEAAEVARSRELASAAISVLDRDPELSVLLATEAVALSEPTFESISALHEALYNHRLLWTVQFSGDPEFFTGALSPDGTRLAMAGIGRLEVWDSDARHQIWGLEVPEDMQIRPFFTKDGTEVVALVGWPRLSDKWASQPNAATPGIYIWDAETGEEHSAFTDFGCPIWDIGQYGSSIDPDLAVVVAGFAETGGGSCDHSAGTVSIVDLKSGAITPVAPITDLDPYQASLSATPDGDLISFVEGDEARVVNMSTGEVISPVDGPVTSFTLLSDGASGVVRDALGNLVRWDIESGSMQTQYGSGGRGDRVALNDDGSLVFHYDHTGEIEAWGTEFGEPAARLVGGPPPPARTVMGAVPMSVATGDLVATFGDNGFARVWSTTPIAEVSSVPIGTGFVTAGSLTVSSDRATLLIYRDPKDRGRAPIFDPLSGEVVGEIDGVGAQTVRLSPEGQHLAGQSFSKGLNGPVQVHDLTTGDVTTMDGLCSWQRGTEFENPSPCVPYPETPFQDWARDIIFSPDGSLVALSGAVTGSVTVWGRRLG